MEDKNMGHDTEERKKARYIEETEFMALTEGKTYEVIEEDDYFYRIIDDSGDDYLYEKDRFEIVK